MNPLLDPHLLASLGQAAATLAEFPAAPPPIALTDQILNLIGIAAFALSGALLAVRRNFDIVGMAVLATITALGGGVIRDVLIGAVPPAALQNIWWMILPLAATVAVFFFHPVVYRLNRAVLVADAVGLGVFCAEATVKAASFGLTPMAAAAMGVLTGVGGGIMRDVLAGQVPSVLRRDTRLYAVPAIAGSLVMAAAFHWGFGGIATQALVAAGICALRISALWLGWTAPSPRGARF